MVKVSGTFLALPSVLDEDGVKRPYKSLSRLMEGISSNSHENYYCLGCFHSFRTKTTLIEKHQNNIFIAVKMQLAIFAKKCVALQMILLIFTSNP